MLFFIALLVASWAAADELPTLNAALYAADDQASAEDEPYRAGRRALDQKRWSKAAELFAESANRGSDHADAAHYWRAYALHKDGRSADAIEALAELRQAFPDSAWIDDAGALKMEIRQGAGQRESVGEADNELKLLALNALMHSDAERALPKLMRFLEGDHPPEASRAGALRAQPAQLGRGFGGAAGGGARHKARGAPDARRALPRDLGCSRLGRGACGDLSLHPPTRRSRRQCSTASWSLTKMAPCSSWPGPSPTPSCVARRFHQLGVMNATGALRELYAAETSKEVKSQILHSMFIGNDTRGLLEIVRSESDEELRRDGIRSLGLVDSDEASAALVDIYDSSGDSATREAILEALFLSDDAAELIRIARAEKDPELREHAFHRLSLMDDEAALDFMMEILEN